MKPLLRRLADPRVLGALFLLAVLPLVLAHQFGRYDMETDFFAEYAPYADRIRRGDLPEAFSWKGPGYHILLALTGLVIRDLFTAGKLISLVSGAFFVGLTAHAARRAGGVSAGVLAALFTAVQPLVLLLSWSVGTDMVFAALALGALVLLVPAEGALSRRRLAAAGLVAGWAFLTRPNGIFLVPAGLGVLVLSGAHTRRALAAGGAAFTALFLAPTGAWFLVHRALHGAWPTSLNYRNLAAAAFPDITSIAPDVYRRTFETEFTGMGDVLRQKGGAILLGALKNIPDYALKNADLLWGPAITLLMLAGIVVLRGRRAREAWMLPAAGLLCFLSLVPLYYEARFGLFLSAPAAFLAAGSLVDFRTGAWRSPFGKDGQVILAAAAIGAAIWTGSISIERTHVQLGIERGNAPLVTAAAILRSRTDIAGSVAARKPHLAWYAGRRYSGIPAAPLTALPDTLRARGVGFLFYSIIEAEMLPEYYPLTTAAGIPPGLRPIHVREEIPFCVLYEVMPENAAAPLSPETAARYERLGRNLERFGVTARAGERLSMDQYHRAVFLMSKGQYAEALPMLETLVRQLPDFPEGNMYLGHALVETGRFEEGLALLDKVAATGLVTREIRLNRGRALTALGRSAEAEAEFRKVLQDTPGDAKALFHLGYIATQGNRAAAAESLFHAAARNGYAIDTIFRTNMGQMKLQLGKFAEADTLLAEGVRRDPGSASLWLLYGYALIQLDRPEEARRAWERVLEIDPANAYARDYLGKLGG